MEENFFLLGLTQQTSTLSALGWFFTFGGPAGKTQCFWFEWIRAQWLCLSLLACRNTGCSCVPEWRSPVVGFQLCLWWTCRLNPKAYAKICCLVNLKGVDSACIMYLWWTCRRRRRRWSRARPSRCRPAARPRSRPRLAGSARSPPSSRTAPGSRRSTRTPRLPVGKHAGFFRNDEHDSV